MHIEAELVYWLDRNMPDRTQNRPRNTKIILSYYGFGQLLRPTLDQLAEEFGLGTRERVRQVIKTCFRSLATIDDLPTTRRIFEAIESRPYVSVAELNQELLQDGLIAGTTSIFGLLNLADDFDFCQVYSVYDSDLNTITRPRSELDGPTYLINSNTLAELKVHRQIARTLPGQLGLAKFEYLSADLGVDSSRIIQLIRSTPNACVVESGGDEWYVFDDRENTLVNSCATLFSLTERCDIQVLSYVLENALHRRTHRHAYPDQSVIRKWIEQSGKFVVEGSSVTFLGPRSELTDMEKITLAYLKQHPGSKYAPFRDHLIQLGYSKPTVAKALASPIVYVDRSAGRKAYVYRSIAEVASAAAELNADLSRYQLIKNRLKRLLNDGTNADIETIARREQGLLREWLFADKQIGVCAICGEQFSTRALVVAHKKKRALCTEAERVDPHIVFPLCTFGCDYLYEHDIIRVVNGEVQIGKLPEEMTADRTRAIAITGRRIPQEWVQGPSGYFRRDLT